MTSHDIAGSSKESRLIVYSSSVRKKIQCEKENDCQEISFFLVAIYDFAGGSNQLPLIVADFITTDFCNPL